MKMDLIIKALLEGDLAKATTLKDAGMDKFISFEGLSKNGRINLGCDECIERDRDERNGFVFNGESRYIDYDASYVYLFSDKVSDYMEYILDGDISKMYNKVYYLICEFGDSEAVEWMKSNYSEYIS